MAIVIKYPKIASNPVKRLQQVLNSKSLIKFYRSKANKISKNPEVIINYGLSYISDLELNKCKLIYNHPDYVKIATNKINTFKVLTDYNIPTVEWTVDYNTAKEWIKNNNKVIVRTKIKAFKGKGIYLIDNISDLECFKDAPLFTKYIPKRKEYRVIIFKNSIIAYMRKIKKKEVDKHHFIRNAEYYNFVNLPDDAVKTKSYLKEIALSVIKATNLDFVAIDILKISNTYDFRVLEINTGFGLGDNNAEKLATAILSDLKERIFTI